MCNSRDYNCYHCGSENTREVKDGEVCDAYGGDYSYQYIRKCGECKKYYYMYTTNADDGRTSNWDRTVSPETITSLEDNLKREEVEATIKEVMKTFGITSDKERDFTYELAKAVNKLYDHQELCVASFSDEDGMEIVGIFSDRGRAEAAINKVNEDKSNFYRDDDIQVFKLNGEEEIEEDN